MNLTKREQFAGMAMQGLIAAGPHDCEIDGVVCDAVMYADALIAELDRTATVKDSLTVGKVSDDGWIPHNPGDPMPCHPDDKVTVKLRIGRVNNNRGGWFFWEKTPNFPESEIIKWKPAE